MFQEMRELALYFLAEKLGCPHQTRSEIETWYAEIHRDNDECLFPFLVENNEDTTFAYILSPSLDDPQAVMLELREIPSESQTKYPFNKPTGSQSAQLGPLFKLSFSKEKGLGPSKKIRETTLKHFSEQAQATVPWAAYFQDVTAILRRQRLVFEGQTLPVPKQPPKEPPSAQASAKGKKQAPPSTDKVPSGLLDLVFERIERAVSDGKKKKTQKTFFVIKDSQGRLPGDAPEYRRYLMETLRKEKYATDKALPHHAQACKLCAARPTTVFPNALKGAGFNFLNADREGAFPSLRLENAWKSYALCASCADLLYIYRQQLLKTTYQAKIAGSDALILPSLLGEVSEKKRFHRSLAAYMDRLKEGSDLSRREDSLLKILSQDECIGSITYIWASFGQLVEEVSGFLTDVLPSRLQELSKSHEEIHHSLESPGPLASWKHPLFPRSTRADVRYDLSMNLFDQIFKRPGGKALQKKNESRSLASLRRELLEALLHKRLQNEDRFWQEWLITAEAYFRDLFRRESRVLHLPLLHESFSSQASLEKKPAFLTLAAWLRHTAMLLFYLRREGAFPMPASPYTPAQDSLKPYFGQESGIDSDEKAFAFVLGVLFGKLVEVQAARGVNVAANSLTWLRRLTLRGSDLPELYNRVTHWLETYGTLANEQVRELSVEVSSLGVRLGSNLQLDQTQTCYFLLLGKALAKTILPSKEK